MINSVLWTPLAFGLVGLFLPKRAVGWWATLGCAVTLGLAIALLAGFDSGASGLQNTVDVNWIPGLGVDADQIPRLLGHNHAGRHRRVPIWLEDLSEPRDVDVHRVRGARRRLGPPQVVDQLLGRHHLVDVDEQQRQHRPLARGPERDGRPASGGLEGAEEPELDPGKRRPAAVPGCPGGRGSAAARHASPPGPRGSRPLLERLLRARPSES